MSKSFSHDRVADGKDEWLTPPEIVTALGPFDLDPCAPIVRPWPTARKHYTVEDDGLSMPWEGKVWLNPPYGNKTGKWLKRMKDHNNGFVLIFARTETSNFHNYVWGVAAGILRLKGRLTFYNVDGSKPRFSGGAPSVIAAYGEDSLKTLESCTLPGYLTYV